MSARRDRRDAWAGARGLRLSSVVPRCLCTLLLWAPRTCRSCSSFTFRMADHPELWTRDRVPARIVWHPYQVERDEVELLRYEAAAHDLFVSFDGPEERTSWYSPGSTWRVQITRDVTEAGVDLALPPELPIPKTLRLPTSLHGGALAHELADAELEDAVAKVRWALASGKLTPAQIRACSDLLHGLLDEELDRKAVVR